VSTSDPDIHYMRSALALARQGLGRVWPNPSVGCVIVKDGYVISRARTADGGRPHAETLALAQAGSAARGADVYVTLEPCAHQGQTPPCAEALIKAGVARVVIGGSDPDPRVNGAGAAMLRAAGIAVTENILAAECAEAHRGFILKVTENCPMVTLKMATSMDGRIATTGGESKWITGEGARAYGHLERAMHDAVAVGVNTVIADDPMLTTRLSGAGHNPVRVIFDTHLRLPETSAVYKSADKIKTWVLCHDNPDEERMTRFVRAGIMVLPVARAGAVVGVQPALKALAGEGITRMMVEGGAVLLTSFIRAGLYDRLLHFQAGTLLGAEGKPAVRDLDIRTLSQRIDLIRRETRLFGADRLEIYDKKA
jgi:diaminohydroxyphosphoribosylaminopyrimidine deaminase/5-amino-6-(5-phosphoribosylamino)uracil reductase